MAGITPTGPVSGVQGLQFVDDNPEWGAEAVTGNPWPSPTTGYVASPLRYPGELYSQGYGADPMTASPETTIIGGGEAVPAASAPGISTPYYDATPWTHAGPRVSPYDTWQPDQAGDRQADSASAHADGLDNRKPGLILDADQDDWGEYYSGPADGVMLGDPGQDKSALGWGSTDITAYPANDNPTDAAARGLHGHRRVAHGKNVPLNFVWLSGSQRPLVSTVHGLQALPVGAGGPYTGQDPAYGYGTAGAVLTRPAGDYEPPADPYSPGPLSSHGLLEGPL